MDSHVNLVILTPGNSVTPRYVRSLLDTLSLFSANNLTVSWQSQYSSNVADAREMTLNGTSESNILEKRPFCGQYTYDKLLWIDSDIVWSPQDALKLYQSDKDVISGVYLQPTGSVMAFTERFGGALTLEKLKEKGTTEPFEVFSTGLGFVCFKSGIFEQMDRPWFKQMTVPYEFEGTTINLPIMGEDLSLFERVNSLGYKVWLDPTIHCMHLKTVGITPEGILAI